MGFFASQRELQAATGISNLMNYYTMREGLLLLKRAQAAGLSDEAFMKQYDDLIQRITKTIQDNQRKSIEDINAALDTLFTSEQQGSGAAP